MPARRKTLPTSGTGHWPQYASHSPVSKLAWSIASVGLQVDDQHGVFARWAIGSTIDEVR